MFTHTFVKVLAFSAFAFAVPPNPLRAEQPDATVKQLLEEINKKLDEHGKKLDDSAKKNLDYAKKFEEHGKKITDARNDISTFKERIDGLDLQIIDLQKSMATTTERDSLAKQIRQLQTDLDALRVQLNNRPLTAGSSPLPAGPTPNIARPAMTPVGTFRITNWNNFDTEVIVNGTPYFVSPNSTFDVSIPHGTFTYSVPTNMVGARTRAIPSGQVFAITINP
jgi:hypothetical protein